jgi:apolipoprotein N-acyltransferase
MERLAGRIILLWGWKRLALAFLAGALGALAQPPFDFFAVCFVSFPVLVWLMDGIATGARSGLAALRAAFGLGWWFGFGYFVAGLWWTGAALLVEADQFAWALPFAILGLPALLAIFYGLATALARLLWSDDIGRLFALAAGFGIAEWLRATVLTGFPWNAIGYAAMPVPLLMQSVGVVGTFGMNALAVLVFCLPAMLAAGRQRRLALALGLVLVAAHLGYGYARLAMPGPAGGTDLVVRLVQPSIRQDEKWDATERDRIFRTYLDLSRTPLAENAPRPDVILWPETAVPYLLTERPDALAAIGDLLQDGQLLLAGAVRAEAGVGTATRYYNAVVAVDSSGTIVDAADKLHLVPFGEYVPLESILSRLGVTRIVESVGGFSPGASRRLLRLKEGVVALPLICYEIIFPGLVLQDAASAGLLLNVTNDAWYGDTPGPYQHFRQAQIRAVEAGLPLIRAANNGVSAVVDPKGRIVDALALDAVGVIDATVRVDHAPPPILGGPFVNGMTVIAFLAFIALALAIWARLRRV